jgi:hypothetical protein
VTNKQQRIAVEGLPLAAARIVASYRNIAAQTHARQDRSHVDKSSHVDWLKSDARKQIKEIREQAEDSFNDLVRSLELTIDPPIGNDIDGFVQEWRTEREWRTLRELFDYSIKNDDNGSAYRTIETEIKRASLANDKDTLRALRRELPVYLKTRNRDEWCDKVETLIAEAQTKLYTPEQHEAVKQLQELRETWKLATLGTTYAAHAVDLPIDESYPTIDSQKNVFEIEPAPIIREALPSMGSAQ